MECHSFTLHTIPRSAKTRESLLRRQIEQNRQMRHHLMNGGAAETIEPRHVKTAAKTLIRHCRVVKPIANYDPAFPQRRLDARFNELHSPTDKQQGFRDRRKIRGTMEQESPQGSPNRC